MTDDKTKLARIDESLQQAEKVLALSREDFQKIPAQEAQKLLRDLIMEARELESWVQQLERTRIELEESRRQATELFDLAPVGYFILDSRGIIADANLTASQMLNFSKEKMVNLPFISFVESQHCDAFRSYLKEIADTGYLLSIELEMHKGDGSLFYGQLQTVALYQKSSLIYRISVADISERKKAEESLRASEKRYRSFIEVTGELGWTTNAEGEVVEDIPSFRRFTGQTYEEIKGWGWSRALHPDDLEHTVQVWKTAVKEKSNYETEYRLRRYDGVYNYFLARGVPLLRNDGSVMEWVGTCIDITERKKIEAELEHIVSIPELNPDPIVELDKLGNVKYTNPAARNLFTNITQEGNTHSFTQNWQTLVSNLGSGKVTSTTREVRVGDSWYAQTVAYVLVSQTIRFYGRDITERKKIEEAIKESEQRYRELADQFPEILFETDIHGIVTYANKKALAAFNLSSDDLSKGINIFEYIIPEQRSTATERFARVLKEGDIGPNEYVILRRDGTTFPSLIHTARIMHEGQVQGVRGIAIDITK